MSQGNASRPIGRRAVITAGLLAGAGGLLWVGRDTIGPIAEDLFDQTQDGVRGPRPRPSAVDQQGLESYAHLADARLYYEITSRPVAFWMEPGFAQRLDACLRSHWTAQGWATPARLTTYGTWIAADGQADSWHHAGRAFDVGRVVAADGSDLVSCRYDLWGERSGAAKRSAERAYWQLAASLHRDFAYVLTYLFDNAHHNHIHVDDGRSGEGRSSFSRGMRVQVQAVQAMCVHVWGRELDITGSWDAPTRQVTGEILREAGIGGSLVGDAQWHAFLTATAARR